MVDFWLCFFPLFVAVDAIRTLVAAKDVDANKALLNRIARERKSRFLSTDFIL